MEYLRKFNESYKPMDMDEDVSAFYDMMGKAIKRKRFFLVGKNQEEIKSITNTLIAEHPTMIEKADLKFYKLYKDPGYEPLMSAFAVNKKHFLLICSTVLNDPKLLYREFEDGDFIDESKLNPGEIMGNIDDVEEKIKVYNQKLEYYKKLL